MSIHSDFDIPRELRNFDPAEVRQQYAALCYRIVNGKVQILLITSRGTQRWIVPKGWPMPGKEPHEAALQEAKEEAGVIGRVTSTPLGTYGYRKVLEDGLEIPCVGVLFPVRVRLMRAEYPEAGQRRRKWFSRKKAAKKVDEPELAELIRTFDPRQWH
ncbi:NUDIX hydrolase [Pseudooceanicola sp. C21-150M6]|uniref:NUDIX hydrolase n=1 Tax=Pseudooceanicola sp. C21-150M6 TaxID=3434355 RepID=UPI003D7FEDED